ncbi:hypothetical protein J2X76_005521 [Neorhizobium sp. 2083]|nr:hypothetical protein [Neorhizobium sp. 2083]
MFADLLHQFIQLNRVDLQAIFDEGSVDKAGLDFDDDLPLGELSLKIVRPLDFLGDVAKRLGDPANRGRITGLRHETCDWAVVPRG